eukprot:scaffold625_cov324-Pavlova_lutheri.AAC.115
MDRGAGSSAHTRPSNQVNREVNMTTRARQGSRVSKFPPFHIRVDLARWPTREVVRNPKDKMHLAGQ